MRCKKPVSNAARVRARRPPRPAARHRADLADPSMRMHRPATVLKTAARHQMYASAVAAGVADAAARALVARKAAPRAAALAMEALRLVMGLAVRQVVLQAAPAMAGRVTTRQDQRERL